MLFSETKLKLDINSISNTEESDSLAEAMWRLAELICRQVVGRGFTLGFLVFPYYVEVKSNL